MFTYLIRDYSFFVVLESEVTYDLKNKLITHSDLSRSIRYIADTLRNRFNTVINLKERSYNIFIYF